MNNYKRWMVGLDNTLIDKSVIQYTAFLAQIFRPEIVYFINVQKDMEVPERIKQQFPELRQPVDEKIKEMMREEAEAYFANKDYFDLEFKVVEGNPFEELIRWGSIKNIDLFIAGRKKELKGTGVLPQKLARKASFSVLFVPEKPNLRVQEIFVPTDFSAHAEAAFESALCFAKRDEAATIHLLNVYHVPYGYHQTRLEKDYSAALKEEATEQYNRMLARHNIENVHISPIFHYDNSDRTAEIICETAHKRNADIILIGSNGRNALLAQLLGSVTEKILRLESDIPVLVVKLPD
jgi:nucleotide-binding universal stress UspA family protein